ncbi:hypothetical protein J5U22_01875 [Saccharolobus shibatae]|uniref:Uncharacterized protein n=1 Tax=Saccharolobus shibatae TaxID=2286 RepID=A0A8F5BVP5_9CREN|nr:hypothetical protein J5U21_01936 [Saccharolobus shibatae]QXJ35328.1 hypothetical protein J5U22_01875 [Saccharolobus shibatae]
MFKLPLITFVTLLNLFACHLSGEYYGSLGLTRETEMWFFSKK